MKESFEKILGQDLKHCIVVDNLMVGSWYLCSSKSVQASDDGARSGVKMSNHSSGFSCLGHPRKEKLKQRNDVSRTVTETLSPVSDLGQDKNEENGTASNGKADEEKYDTLELRNR